jgi:signal transduction histidine kinase
VGWQFAAFGMCLPLVAVTGLLFPLVRPLEAAAARALCAPGAGGLVTATDRSWPARRRTAGWFTLHVGLGTLVSGATLAVPPAALVLFAIPFSASLRDLELGWLRTPVWAAPLLATGMLLALATAAYAAGALLARCAPALLGPTPAERLAVAEERAADLARRNRLARELHDSVGHALSAVTLQAGAARKVFDRDPEFVREALASIERATHDAVAELDTVLGLLRQDEPGPTPTTPAPGLARDLAGLLERTRAAGVSLTVTRSPGLELAKLPPDVSRETYRIVQEGLGNVLKHAGEVAAELRFTATEEELEIVLENQSRGPAGRAEPHDGRGLRGITERARLLGGTVEAGPCAASPEPRWRLTVRLPL